MGSMRRWGVLLLVVAGLGVPAATALAHPEPGDVDGDGVRDEFDNCAQTRNSDQKDVDGDRLGDRCDPDADGDGVANNAPDNCWLVANRDQANEDGDAYGDVCDVDTDRDGWQDPVDNCPDIANTGQQNYDYDETGDVCDPDDDFDGEFDTVDNCPLTYNYDQVDADGDGIGAACDASDTPAAPPGSPPPPPDVRAPTLRLTLARTLRLSELGRSIAVQVKCDEQCTLRAELFVRRRRIAAGTAALGDRGTTYVFMRKLRRLVPAKATLRLIATDAAGNVRSASRRLQLRR
jgi:hypothetical protein